MYLITLLSYQHHLLFHLECCWKKTTELLANMLLSIRTSVHVLKTNSLGHCFEPNEGWQHPELLCLNNHLEQAQNELHPVPAVSEFPGLAPFQTDEMQDKVVQETNTTHPYSPGGRAMLYGEIIFLQ